MLVGVGVEVDLGVEVANTTTAVGVGEEGRVAVGGEVGVTVGISGNMGVASEVQLASKTKTPKSKIHRIRLSTVIPPISLHSVQLRKTQLNRAIT